MGLKEMVQKSPIEKKLALFLGNIFIISLVPLLIIAFDNVMCADDFSYGYLTHRTYVESHSVIDCLKAALSQVHASYLEWQGTFSAIFLMALQPGAFTEQAYFLATYIIFFFFIGGTIYFVSALFKEWLRVDINLAVIIVSVFLLILFN